MQVDNIFVEETLKYTEEKPNLQDRENEIEDIFEIWEYCSQIQERVKYSDNIWDQEVEPGVLFVEWLYSNQGQGNEDIRRALQELLDKESEQIIQEQLYTEQGIERIQIGMGKYPKAVWNKKGYIECRRKILSEIKNAEEYGEFMPSCFINSCFAEDILSGMRGIQNFYLYAEEITRNLAVLNDEAITLYERYHDNLNEAMRILASKLLECSGDPRHRNSLLFPFVYEEQLNGENVARKKDILCEPHLKLIRRNSNLRIYFLWCDSDVGKGEKVLVGKIGGHPY